MSETVLSFPPESYEMRSTEFRMARLEAIEEVRALKAHYSALADAKYASNYERIPPDRMAVIAGQQAACFTRDAVWAGGNGFGGDLIGREALTEWFKNSPWRFAMHYYVSDSLTMHDSHREIEGYWRLMQIAIRHDNERAVWLGAVTHEKYKHEDGHWLISYMKFAELHMMELGDGRIPIAPNFSSLDLLRTR